MFYNYIKDASESFPKLNKNDWSAPEQTRPAVSHSSRPESLAFFFGVLHQILYLLQCLWEEGFAWDVLNSLSIVVEHMFRKTENLDKDFYM